MNKTKRKRIRDELLADADFVRCGYCGREVKARRATLDHIVPQSRNGSSNFQNLVWACAHCNQSKRDRTPEEWARDILAVRPIRETNATTKGTP